MNSKAFRASALALILGVAFAGAANADVTQTAVGIQQSYQSQYLEGRGSQTGVSVSNLGQFQMGRPSYRGENIQQTAAGVQMTEQAQQGFGRVNQTMVDVREMRQRQFNRLPRR
ncbi:MAG: hypothetical protein KME03_10115 [Aphanocapsa lilacina HA4352-LM1]|jgi:hypothetical protein|nr:hypothetical protein [Aphanocapsa lilacina HA4352-LM1]